MKGGLITVLLLLAIAVNIQGLDTANWMRDLGVHDKTYTRLKIPATHNSATGLLSAEYSADTTVDATMAFMPQLETTFGYYGVNGSLVKDIMIPWMQCQSKYKTIYRQLLDGIRHFDFRVCKKGTEYYACHGFIGQNYKDIITQIRTFLLFHPEEFISLDFNHLYGISTHSEFIGLIKGILGDLIIPKGNVNNPLGTLTGRVFIFYDNNSQTDFDTSNSINTTWANKDNMQQLVPAVISLQNSRTDLNKLFVNQFLITPSLNTIATSLVRGPRSVEDLADEYYWRIPSTIIDQFNKTLVNIVNTDFYSRQFVRVIIDLNQ